MIILVHTIETYILNPRIVAAMFKISPLVTLMILYVGHKLFGLWGMVLGVPVSVFIFRHVILGTDLDGRPHDTLERCLEEARKNGNDGD
jgi:predicted PurR-regulated permease PerM